MKLSIIKIIAFTALVGLFISCEKDPVEIVNGKWKLISIEGSDTTWSIHHVIERIVTLSYNNDPLTITYDSITSKVTFTFNLLLQLQFEDDGTLYITEEYRNMENIVHISRQNKSSWHNDPFSIKKSFYLWIYDEYNPIAVDNSLIFIHPTDPYLFDEDDITKKRLVLHDFYGTITYTFKKF